MDYEKLWDYAQVSREDWARKFVTFRLVTSEERDVKDSISRRSGMFQSCSRMSGSCWKVFFTLQPMCVEVGRLRVDEARDRLQTKKKKTLQHDF